MASRNLLILALAQLLCAILVSASALPGLAESPSTDLGIERRVSICRPQSKGCVPFFTPEPWYSFEITIPPSGSPQRPEVTNRNTIEATLWNRSDGSVFLGIHLVEGYTIPIASEIEISASFRNEAIRLNNNIIHLEGQSGLRTIPAADVNRWRNAAGTSRGGGAVTLTIRWRIKQDL